MRFPISNGGAELMEGEASAGITLPRQCDPLSDGAPPRGGNNLVSGRSGSAKGAPEDSYKCPGPESYTYILLHKDQKYK